MHSLVPALLADISNLPWVAIVAVSGSFILTIVIVVCGLYFAQRRQQLWHETARLALEKGQPLPPAPDEPAPAPTEKRDRAAGDIRAGLVLIGVGGGLYLFFDAMPVVSHLRFVGAIPGFIGVALLLFGVLSVLLGRNKSS